MCHKERKQAKSVFVSLIIVDLFKQTHNWLR